MFAAILREQRHTWKIQNHVTIYPICDYAYYPIPGVPGLQKSRRPGTARGPGTVSSKGGRARPVKTAQTWNGKRPWSGLQQGRVCQACQNHADLERHHAIDAAPEGAGVPGLTKPHKPGTGPCLGGGSTRGRLIFSLHSLTVAQQIIFYLCRH